MSFVQTGSCRTGMRLQGSLLGLCVGLLSIGAAAGCSGDKTTTGSQRSLNSTGAPYVHIFSGPWDATEGIRHYVAVRNVTTDGTAAVLDVLSGSSQDAPTSLVTASTAAWSTVQISPAGTERVLFVDKLTADTFIGTIMFANLSETTPLAKAMPKGTEARPYNIYFGANGDQMLFIGQLVTKAEAGTLYYWNGTGEPTQLDSGVSANNVTFSTDRTKALIVANYKNQTGLGDLRMIDMSLGTSTLIDTNVVIDAKVFGQDPYVGVAIKGDLVHIPAYSASPSLTAVAYTKITEQGVPETFRWPRSTGADGKIMEDPLRGVAAAGVFPSVSASGKVVAYFEYKPSGGPESPASQFLHVWSVETGADIYKIRLLQMPALCPKISADDRFITFLTNIGLGGQGGPSPAMGTLKIAPVKAPDGTSAADTVLQLGTDVDWGSVRFGPNFINQPTTSLTFNANLKDLGGAPSLAVSTGNVSAVNLENGFPEDVRTIAEGIASELISVLPNSNGLAFEKRAAFGTNEADIPYVWVPGMKVARQLNRGERGDYYYKRGSLKTSGDVQSLGLRPAVRPDEVGYIILPSTKDAAAATSGILRGVKIKAGGELAVDVDTAQDRQTYSDFFFDSIGHVLGFLAMSGDVKSIQVWDLPFPDAQ